MELITDFEWIPFENLKNITNDLYQVFMQSEYMDESRIEAISNGVTHRLEKLQKMAIQQK